MNEEWKRKEMRDGGGGGEREKEEEEVQYFG
jgi:hypothetical protein